MKKSIWMASVFALSLTASACAEEPAETADASAETAGSNAEAIVSGATSSAANAAVQETDEEPEIADGGGMDQAEYFFPDEAWRAIDQENALYINTEHGMIVVELAPEFAPIHVERMTTLARQNFYDYLVWHRVLDGFVAQGGGSRANPAHSTDLPDIPGEFTIRRSPDLQISELQPRMVNPRQDTRMAPSGFWNSFPAATEPVAQSGITADGRVTSWLLHCTGAASMARTSDPNSAGSQFYITRGDAEHLNTQYTVWGRVRHGMDAVNQIAIGTMGQDLGFSPDSIISMRVGSDLPEDERLNIEVVDTNSAAFADYLETLRNADGMLPDVCAIPVHTRISE